MNPTQLFWNYLLPILEKQKAAHGVVHVGQSDADRMDRFIADSRSEAVYPGIFIMRPKYHGKSIDNALLLANFGVLFYVFCEGRTDSYDDQDAAFDRAETIAMSVLQQIQHDSRTYLNYLDFNSIQVEPVVYMTGVDAACGYEVKLKFGLEANETFC